MTKKAQQKSHFIRSGPGHYNYVLRNKKRAEKGPHGLQIKIPA
jgi:hypothetical protein